MNVRPLLQTLEPYVPGRRIKGGVKLSSNENALGPSPLALQAIARIASDVHRYPDGSMHDLRSAIADFWKVSPDMVLCGNGSDEIMVMIAGALVEPGTNAVTGAHTFSQYGFATRIFGGEVRATPMADGRFDLEAILEKTDDQTRIVWLCSPNNPTGAIIAHDEIVAFLERLSPEVLVVIDEAYGEFVDSDDYPDTIALMERHANIIRLRTFSKVYGLAALRVGYAIAPPEVIDAVGHLRQPFNVGTIAQSAAAVALSDADFVRRTLDNNRVERRRLAEFLDRIRVPYIATEANFVCASFAGAALRNGERGASAVVKALADKRVAVRPLRSFGLPESVRISVGLPAEMDALYDALDEVIAGAPVAE